MLAGHRAFTHSVVRSRVEFFVLIKALLVLSSRSKLSKGNAYKDKKSNLEGVSYSEFRLGNI